MSQWLTQDTPAGVQVLPLDDLIVHVHEGCPCAPVTQRFGSTCWGHSDTGQLVVRTLTTHQAMDGRE